MAKQTIDGEVTISLKELDRLREYEELFKEKLNSDEYYRIYDPCTYGSDNAYRVGKESELKDLFEKRVKHAEEMESICREELREVKLKNSDLQKRLTKEQSKKWYHTIKKIFKTWQNIQ